MKKFSLLVLMMAALAAAAFAAPEPRPQDSRIVAQWDGTDITVSLVYHLEIWDQNGGTTDIGPFLTPINNLRKYGSVSFLIHSNNGYIVVLYASPDWAPALPKPQGVISKYSVAGDLKQIIRTVMDSREFKSFITRPQFLIDLEMAYMGLK